MRTKMFNLKSVSVLFALMLVFWSCEEDQDITKVEVSASFTSEVEGLKATFTNTSENATSYEWDFGDGNTSTEKNPSNTYEAGGDYTVTLTAYGEDESDMAEETTTVTVTSVDPCLTHDGSESGNLIVGGQFESCDAQYWTALTTGQKNDGGTEEHAKFEFGYTDYKPTNGEGGALYIHPDNDEAGGEEGTILYQEVSLTKGLYQFNAQVKLDGENEADPTSAMNSYWFEFYVHNEEPVEGDGYNNTAVSGWIYGGWTGWAFEIPAMDGFLPHTLMAANQADDDGNFVVEEDGTYYVAIKFGKGNDADGASFGEGIALDKMHLARVGDIPECYGYEETPIEGNYIKGGGMETCDANYWTVIAANLDEVPPMFGYTDYAPANGTDGALYFSTPEANDGVGGTAGTVYQYMGILEAGTYEISALVKQGGVEGGNSQFWWEMYVWTEEPVAGEEYQPKESDADDAFKVAPIGGYTHAGWGPRPDIGVGVATTAHDGQMQWGHNPYDQANNSGQFTIAEDGEYYFVFKFGTWEGSLGEGISIDDLKITKVVQ
ncbi:PKD domain-containing protein [Flammeovirga yaeyamensis]|uniref:PKD domain-containing protein n=2 Tax=Flammeovirga yaeyamensis TaxID=367791 RepID=A0AAX1NAP5_9BACT|nr:PKD domain-containing protein [Flammeovirga yaeyamensis]MBB3699321.1 PKD repeat protein [Flammeovirga yaeyamensis]NMF35417.1 PKD domain-containing protein [Flammeovirga yaeyamensis]QWG04277.1 PKD domain-containing protein [Flammeovirga yaeyamensis]